MTVCEGNLVAISLNSILRNTIINLEYHQEVNLINIIFSEQSLKRSRILCGLDSSPSFYAPLMEVDQNNDDGGKKKKKMEKKKQ